MKYTKLMILTLVVALVSLAAISSATGQTSNKLGAKVFESNCSPCHAGGENTIEATKTLKTAALKENGFNGVVDIKKRVQEGKGVMPVFKDQLKANEIDAVAGYVWEKAQSNWK